LKVVFVIIHLGWPRASSIDLRPERVLLLDVSGLIFSSVNLDKLI